jgi:hypothetical protein
MTFVALYASWPARFLPRGIRKEGTKNLQVNQSIHVGYARHHLFSRSPLLPAKYSKLPFCNIQHRPPSWLSNFAHSLASPTSVKSPCRQLWRDVPTICARASQKPPPPSKGGSPNRTRPRSHSCGDRHLKRHIF